VRYLAVGGGATGRKQTNKWSRQQIHWVFIKFLCDASINFCLKIGCDFSETRKHIARSRFPVSILEQGKAGAHLGLCKSQRSQVNCQFPEPKTGAKPVDGRNPKQPPEMYKTL